ncbi:MAG: HDOD domain-containing protein, partial [Vicinamibacterales bacterium]|nr:HDOD domain-containing protein [Vicinamibacterales bacterium]
MLDQSALVLVARALDPLPASVSRLATPVTRDNWSMKEAEEIISLDQALTVRLLRLANSAAAGSRTQIVTIEDALVRMGIGVVLSMATGSSVQRLTKTGLPEYGLSEGDLWRHSVAAALAAEGVERGDRVAILANSRMEWCVVDLANFTLGAVTVPVYQSNMP